MIDFNDDSKFIWRSSFYTSQGLIPSAPCLFSCIIGHERLIYIFQFFFSFSYFGNDGICHYYCSWKSFHLVFFFSLLFQVIGYVWLLLHNIKQKLTSQTNKLDCEILWLNWTALEIWSKSNQGFVKGPSLLLSCLEYFRNDVIFLYLTFVLLYHGFVLNFCMKSIYLPNCIH